MSESIKTGDTIAVNYTGKFEDDTVFDSSEGKQPLQFTVGSGQIIKGFDEAVVGMKKGEKKTITLAPEEAYGPRQEGMIIEIPKSQIPADMTLEVGMRLHLRDPNGNPVPAVVGEITDEVVKMDANHPMAGKTLIFDIEIAETGLTPASESCSESEGHQCTGCGKH
jgi:peptidylprolyl isomerase